MAANIGYFLLLLCCLGSVYGSVAAWTSGWMRHRRLYRSAKWTLTAICGFVFLASAILVVAFFSRDYSVLYVVKNSSNDLPPWFTLTAFWSSLEGSHLLWTLLITLLATIAAWTHAKDNEHIMPHVLGTLMAVMAWMFYLLVTHSDPFVQVLPPAPNGNGMNELLQNPYMVVHPPTLFLGYTALAIPFAYALAALSYGDITQGWLKTVRRWTLFAWIALTAAITLGGRWAYVELGWAGYWAWDPVENSSFLPWLMATALLHSLLVQDRLGHLKRLSIVLAVLAFFLSFFGTFITRSGVITSVHSFAESNIGPNYLLYLAGLAVVSMTLYAFRAPSILPSETEKVWGVSKESALLVTQFFLISFAAIVFIGTIFPIVSEALTGQRISVQAPYFNAFAPFIGFGMIVMVAVGNLMRYQTQKMPGAKKVVLWSTVAAIPLTLAAAYFGDVSRTVKTSSLIAQYVGFYLCSWCFGCLVGDFILKMKDLRWRWLLLFKRNLAYFGAFLAHVGFVLAIAGFLGNYRGMERKVTLNVNETTELYQFQFKLVDKVSVKQEHNATLVYSPVTVYRNGKEVGHVEPAQASYPTKPMQSFNEIGVLGSFWNDVYIVLADFDKEHFQQATLHIHVNPTVRIVWISVFIMCFGGMLCLWDRYRGQRSRDVVAGQFDVEALL